MLLLFNAKSAIIVLMTVGFQDTDTREQDISEAQVRLDEILGRSLNAHNINTYADEALSDLVLLVDGIVTTQKYEFPLSDIENERRALKTAGLDPDTVELTLDHIANVAESTRRLDAFIMKKTKLVDRVLVPPDSDKTKEITPGDGSFEKPKERIPKLKTLLLLLETEFDIDIETLPDFSEGSIDPSMMRSTSYKLVQIPDLERTVLICDEVGNTTFVFDQTKCDELAISPLDLYELTKDQQRELIRQHELGVQINYSKQYVDQLAKAFRQPVSNFDDGEVTDIEILRPDKIIDNIPAGYCSIYELCERVGITKKSMDTRIQKIGLEKIGTILKYREPGMHGSPVRIFSATQQELLDYDKTYQHGGLICDQIPEGYVIGKDVAMALGLTMAGLNARISRFDKNQFGERKYYDRLLILSPEQHALLREQYDDICNELPNGYVTVQEYADKVGVKVSTLRIRIGSISDEFGTVSRYREIGKSKNPSIIISPTQQTILDGYYHNVRNELPTGYVDYDAMAADLGVSKDVIKYRIARFDSKEFGVVKRLLSKGPSKVILSPEQQAFIRADHERRSRRTANIALESAIDA